MLVTFYQPRLINKDWDLGGVWQVQLEEKHTINTTETLNFQENVWTNPIECKGNQWGKSKRILVLED